MVKSAITNKDRRLDSVFHALSDPTRRAILRDIASRQRTVSQIARPYRMSLAAVSKHLKVLDEAELISREKRGSFQIVRLNPRPMREAEQWLDYYKQFWNEKLNALQQLLEQTAADAKTDRTGPPRPIPEIEL